MSASHKGAVTSEETKIKLSIAGKGRKDSDETRAKKSAGARARPPEVVIKQGNRIRDYNLKRAVKIQDQNGKVYSSICEAARILGVNKGNISNVLNGRQISAYGYTFRYWEQL